MNNKNKYLYFHFTNNLGCIENLMTYKITLIRLDYANYIYNVTYKITIFNEILK